MKKFLLFFALIGMVSVHIMANPINVAQAQLVAEQFVNQSPMAKAPSSQAGRLLSLAYRSLSPAGESDYYVFNRGTDGGFIIVAGDDCVPAVLGFADSGTFDGENVPENVSWWLSEYQREIRFARSRGASARQMPLLSTSVAPLMKTIWDQGAPYNNYCPIFNDGNSRAVTGCVATAVAQIMKKHNWPPVGEGSVTYDCNVNGEDATTLTADFDQIPFKWESMRDNYNFGSSTQVQKDAVATLMSAVGIAVEMQYGASSGAFSIKAMEALRDHFHYDKSISFCLRDFMPLDEWEQMLRDELDAGRPIYYAGQADRSGGHAFVFDGYNNAGYFHVNWGWGGRYNGYFACTALNPGSQAGYNSGQEVIIGIKPDEGGSSASQPLQGYMSEFFSTMRSARLGVDVPLKMNNYTFLGDGELDAVDFAVAVMDSAGTEILDTCYVTQEHLVKGYTYYFGDDEPISMVLPKELPAGKYRLVVVYSLDSLNTIVPFIRPADSVGYIMIDVSEEGLAQFYNIAPLVGSLELMRVLEPKAETMPADDVHAQAVVKAVGGLYDGELTLRVLNASMEVIGTGRSAVSLKHVGEQQVVEIVASATATEGDTCYVALVNPEDNASYWCEPAPFIIGEWPVPVPAFITPEEDFVLDFGKVLTETTIVESLFIQGENLTGNVELAISGPDSERYRVSPATIASANAMNGAKVSIIYSAFAVGNHEAQLLISGGGVEQPLVIPLYGAAYDRGDCNGDGVVDVVDVNHLINIILDITTDNTPRLSDVNGDGHVDVADVNLVINLILGLN